MKRITVFVIILALIIALAAPASANGEADAVASAEEAESLSENSPIDWDQYSLDDLLALRDTLDQKIEELQRKYAMEHGDRIITLDETEATLYVGDSLELIPSVERIIDDAPEDTMFVWTSSDESIATVSATGIVKGVQNGDVEVTCAAEDNEYICAVSTVHVVLPVSAVSISEPPASLLLSEKSPEMASAELALVIQPENAYCQEVKWTSKDESIISVDETGHITAHSAGKTVITATSLDDYSSKSPKSASCTITVLQAVDSIELSDSVLAMNLRASKTIKATVLPNNANKKAVSWESSDPSVVKVSANGQLTATGCGSAVITCVAQDGGGAKAECEVSVVQMVTGLKLKESVSKVTMSRGETKTFSVVVTPDNATNRALSWESSDKAVATVDNKGSVHAVSSGTAKISCSTTDGSEKTLRFSVFIPSIGIESDTYVVTNKKGLDIPVNMYGKMSDFSYSVSNSNYFSVTQSKNNSGKITLTITPKKAGTAYIDLKDKSDSQSNRRITIKVDHSAAYDSVSYPAGNYEAILREPSKYKGKNISIYGKVLQKSEGWFTTTLRIGTGGWGYYDNVFYVTYSNSADIGDVIIEDDMVTIYGVCSGTETYKTILGARITIPSLDAEKIFLGRN